MYRCDVYFFHGDGSAVTAVTNAAINQNVKIFGVEVNDSTVEVVKKNPYVADVLNTLHTYAYSYFTISL